MIPFTLSDFHLSTLRAAANRIIPADDYAGAADAGAVEFILRLLNTDLSGEQLTYVHGLAGVEAESQAVHGRSFASLPLSQQDALLANIEADRVQADWIVSPIAFFPMLVEHVLESFYADPQNGGNRDAVSWKMIGFRAEGGTW
jgi:Gluconate 2-dehydrogenase subunit 3